MLPNAGSFPLAAGNSFKLFNASSYHGAFAAITPVIAGPGLLWDTTDLSTNGTLRLIAATQPLISSCIVGGSNLVFQGTGGRAGAGQNYAVLSTTNLALPLIQWKWLTTNALDASGNSQVITPISPGGPPTFFTLRLL